MKRRTFIQSAGKAGLAVGLGSFSSLASANPVGHLRPASLPVSICTWGFTEANQRSADLLVSGTPALDAAIAGVEVEEANLKNTTVGKGGSPDSSGRVTLDASVMAPDGRAGSVSCVENIVHVARLARLVMEKTPHVMLTARGAEDFAYANGFKPDDLLTDESLRNYEEWRKEGHYQPEINVEDHDTIGMITMDENGDLAAACTTSGLAYKMPGRVGDSPVIGSGLYVDNEVGAAAATGLGEEIMRRVGSFLIVELMRNGMSPQDACREAVRRTVIKVPDTRNFQVCYIAMNKAGDTGCYSLKEGFAMMEFRDGKNQRVESGYWE